MQKKNLIKNRIFSFRYFFKAFSFIKGHKSLLRYVFLQILITMVSYIASFSFVVINFANFFNQTLGFETWLSQAWYYTLLYYLLLIIFFILAMILVFFVTMMLLSAIFAPLNSLMADKVYTLYTGKELPKPSHRFFKQTLISIGYEIQKIIVFSLIMIVIFFTFFIPIIGPVIFSVLSIFFTIFGLVFESFDYSMEREELKIKKRIFKVLKEPLVISSFGLAFYLFFLIPLVNFVAWPILITSGTMLYEDLKK